MTALFPGASRCIGAALILSAIVLSNGAQSAEDLHYRPAECRTDAHGKMYIALDKNVLSVPLPTSATVVGDIYPGTGITKLTPPDAKQPLGCPDNPLQLESYAFNYVYEEGLNGKGGVQPEARPRPDLLELINNNRAGLKSPSDEWIGETSQMKVAQRICSMATVHEHLSNGLEACRVKPVQKNNVSIEDWGHRTRHHPTFMQPQRADRSSSIAGQVSIREASVSAMLRIA